MLEKAIREQTFYSFLKPLNKEVEIRNDDSFEAKESLNMHVAR